MATSQGLSLAGKAVFGSLCAGTFGLGVWQTQRFFEKQDLIRQRNADLEAPPTTDLLAAVDDDKNATTYGSFRRIQLQGQYLHSAEFLVGPRGPPPGALPDKPGSSAQGMSSAPQGYFVLTPLVPASPEIRQQYPMVVINRGWVPRHAVVPDRQRQPPASASLQSQQPPPLQWDRPVPAKNEKYVQVVVVPAKPETPRFLTAEHKMNERPPKLFWYDLETMQQWLGYNNNASSQQQQLKPLHIFTAVASNNLTSEQWPAAPPPESVGAFKVEPAVHAAYAFTWYSLSAAGMYMTRKLLTRGR